jgi:hypothetical protein
MLFLSLDYPHQFSLLYRFTIEAGYQCLHKTIPYKNKFAGVF